MKRATVTQASALMIVLWALFILTAAVFAWARLIQQEIQLSGLANREQEARALAHSGMAIALHPLVSQTTPLLDEQFAADQGFKVRIVGEGGKLNINWLLAGEEPRKLTILKQWLELMELTFQERETFVDSLLDYIDADDQKRLNGVENFEDYQPANRPLQSVDELTKVANAEPLTTKPGWREQLTVFSQGPIDLSAADEPILRLLGIGEANIERYVKYRRGADELDGTLDDWMRQPGARGPEQPKPNMDAIYSLLGLNKQRGQELLGALVVAEDKTVHITSIGTSAKVVRQLEVVARKGGPNPQILSWTE